MTIRLELVEHELRRKRREALIDCRVAELRVLAARTAVQFWDEREAERAPVAWRPFPEGR